MSTKPKLLYILAPSYSGSTLLTYLLGRHPKIATIGELKATSRGPVESYRCSCGELILECGFWRQVESRAAEAGIELDLGDFETVLARGRSLGERLIGASVRGPLFERLRALGIAVWPGTARKLRARIERNDTLMRILTELQGGEIFLDGSKDGERLLHFIDSGRWDVRVIYLQRDGRGLIASIMKYLDCSFDEAAARWARSMRELEAMRARLPDATVIDLKYEALCSDPERELGRLFDWLGLDARDLETDEIERGTLHVLGNNAMRLGSLSEIRLDEKWRSKLSDGEQQRFIDRFGDIHRRLGYAG